MKKEYKTEPEFQADLVKEIMYRFSGSYVLKNDPSYIQGFPDLLVLIKDKWFALECKVDANASHQPNQDYYISDLDRMAYARFVYPENVEEVLNEIQSTLESGR